MNFAARLKAARKHAGLTQGELAAKLGINQVSISDLERGKSQSSSHAYKIALICKVTPDWLIMGEGSMLPTKGLNKGMPGIVTRYKTGSEGVSSGSNVAEAPEQLYRDRKAPVISWVQAGEWSEAVDLHQPGYGDSYEPVPETAGPSVFWLRVVGDSMTAPTGQSIPEGMLILVDPDGDPINGSLVVAKLDDSQEVTFKKLVIDAGQKYLKPLNPAYSMLPINGNCRIVGVVTEAKIKF